MVPATIFHCMSGYWLIWKILYRTQAVTKGTAMPRPIRMSRGILFRVGWSGTRISSISARSQTRITGIPIIRRGVSRSNPSWPLRTLPYRNQMTAPAIPPRMERRSHHFWGRPASGVFFDTFLNSSILIREDWNSLKSFVRAGGPVTG
jgi:hypothetical protein